MTRMSMKLFKVWTVLLEHPGEWMDALDISYCTDLTPRQVVSLMAEISAPEVVRKMTEARPRQCICYNGTASQAEEMRRQIMIRRYDITEDLMDSVVGAMSIAGWTTITDISEETGLSKANVSKVLRVLPPGAICTKPTGTGVLYRRA